MAKRKSTPAPLPPDLQPPDTTPKIKKIFSRMLTPEGPIKTFYESLRGEDPLTGQPRYQFNAVVPVEEYYERFRIPQTVTVGEGKAAKTEATRVSGIFCLVRRKIDPITKKAVGYEVVRERITDPDWTRAAETKDQAAKGARSAAEDKSRKKEKRHTVADLMKTKAWKISKMLEAAPVAEAFGDNDNDTQGLQNVFDSGYFGSPNNEFIPVQPGPFNKQKYMYDYLKAHGWCFYMKNHSAIAQALVNTKTNYVMGKGVSVTALNDDLDDFIQDYIRVNDRQTNWWINCASTVWAGEFMDWKKTTPWEAIPLVSQFIDLAEKYAGKILPTPQPIDPSSVWEIITELTNINNPFYYHQQMQTQYQLTWKPKDKASEYVINDIPANEVLHTRVNVVQGEKRGRADLEPVLPWLKLEEDYQKSKAFRAFVEASFVMKTKIMGDDDDVNRYKEDPEVNRIPVPGSKLIENEAVDTTFLETKGTSSSGADEVGESLKAKCAVGIGLSPDMLGAHSGTGGSGRQSGLMKAEPAHKSLEMRQTVMEYAIRKELDWAINIARENGLIPATQTRQASMKSIMQALRRRDFKGVMKEAASLLTMADVEEPIEMTYEVTFPEILSEDRKDKLNMLALGEAQNWWSKETAGNAAGKEMSFTTYDFDTEQEKIRMEQQTDPKVQAMYDAGAPPARPRPMAPSQAAPAPGPQDDKPKPGSGADKVNFKKDARRK
jgi:hypothetical protein